MSTSKQSSNVGSVVGKLFEEYRTTTPTKIKLVDVYMLCILLTGIIQFVYCCLVGTYPFNAFLSGFISTVASFVLAGKFKFKCWFLVLILNILIEIKASYRIQINKANQEIFVNVTQERAFADFIFAHVILHLVVINFIG